MGTSPKVGEEGKGPPDLSMEYTSPVVKGKPLSALLLRSWILAVTGTSKRMVPFPEPVLTVTV